MLPAEEDYPAGEDAGKGGGTAGVKGGKGSGKVDGKVGSGGGQKGDGVGGGGAGSRGNDHRGCLVRGGLVITFEGPSFLYHQARRSMS